MTSLTDLPLELGLQLFRYPKEHAPNLSLSVLVPLSLDQTGQRGFNSPHFSSVYVCWQYEGAVDEDGKSPSIWNTYAHSGSQLLFSDLTSQ